MATIVQCDCGAEYKRTEAKFLVPHTGHASCKVCGATLESWLESTHVATFELVNRLGRWGGPLRQPRKRASWEDGPPYRLRTPKLHLARYPRSINYGQWSNQFYWRR